MIPRYEDEKISEIWSDKFRFQLYCDLEIEILNKFIENNDINEPLVKFFNLSDSDVDTIKSIEKNTKHELASVVDFLCSKVNSSFVHFGLTSSDILDSAYSIQIYASYSRLVQKIDSLLSVLHKLSELHNETVICGRTHGQVAELVSLGKKLNLFGAILDNCMCDIDDSIRNYLAVKISGPTGNQYHKDFGDFLDSSDIQKIASNVMSRNGIINYHEPSRYTLQTQNINRNFYFAIFRDMISFFVALEQLVTELRLLSQSGIEEFSETRTSEQKGSSSMPHKCNPITLENVSGLIRMIKSYMTLFMDTCSSWSERDMSHSSIERIAAPDFFHLACNVTEKMTNVLTNGQFIIENINKNIDEKENEWKSSYILNDLIYNKKMNRQEAYNLVKNDNSVFDKYKHVTKQYLFASIKEMPND